MFNNCTVHVGECTQYVEQRIQCAAGLRTATKCRGYVSVPKKVDWDYGEGWEKHPPPPPHLNSLPVGGTEEYIQQIKANAAERPNPKGISHTGEIMFSSSGVRHSNQGAS